MVNLKFFYFNSLTLKERSQLYKLRIYIYFYKYVVKIVSIKVIKNNMKLNKKRSFFLTHLCVIKKIKNFKLIVLFAIYFELYMDD